MERLKKRQQQSEEQGISLEAKDNEFLLGDHNRHEICGDSNHTPATEASNQEELRTDSRETNKLKSEDHSLCRDKPVTTEGQVSSCNFKTIGDESLEKSFSGSANQMQVCSSLLSDDIATEASIKEEGNVRVVAAATKKHEASPVSASTKHESEKGSIKRKAPRPPAQQHQRQSPNEETKDQKQETRKPRLPRSARYRMESQASIEDSKVKKRAPAPPKTQRSETKVESNKKQKRKAPGAPPLTKQRESSQNITIEENVNEEAKKTEESQHVEVSAELENTRPIRKDKRRAPQRPGSTTEKRGNDVDKSKQPSNQTVELTDKPKPRKRKEKAPVPPVAAATQPVASRDEIAWAEKQLEEKKAEDKEKEMQPSIPVKTSVKLLCAVCVVKLYCCV